MDAYRLLKPDSFILKHHIIHHRDLQLGDLKIRFEVKGKHQSAFRRQISEAVSIKMSRGDPMKLNMNNKYEYTRCILPYIGALAPVEEEEAADKKLTECIKSMKAKYKKKGIRLIEGTRMHNFPEGSPFELVPEFLRSEEEERALREEEEKKNRENVTEKMRALLEKYKFNSEESELRRRKNMQKRSSENKLEEKKPPLLLEPKQRVKSLMKYRTSGSA